MGLTVDTRILKKFKHRVHVCRNEDVVVDGQLIFQRRSLFEGWAMIDPRRTQTFGADGHSIYEERDRRTHFIRMRYNPDVEYSVAAWLYEERRKSPPRWFKILFSGDEYETSQYWKFECRLMERGDDILQPITAGEVPGSILGVPEGIEI